MDTGRINRPLLSGRMLCLLLFVMAGMCTVHAQQTLSGKVISEVDKSPVAGAFVYVHEGKTLTGYGLSDGDGAFSVKIPAGKSADRITATCLGFNSKTVPVDGRKAAYTISMTENHLSIKASKVVASVAEEKGDTVSYAAGAFSDGTERALGDLLEKIPGLSVSRSGGILYNGSYINKFYVEGMDLMGSGYGVVTKNLSPEKIARVEVYKRHQPIRSLVGIQQTDRSAVNIILKEDARNTWAISGDFIGGAPEFPLFDVRALLTRFSKGSQDLYLLKGNDIGGDIVAELTRQQYMGKTGAFLVSAENLDSDFASRLNPRRASLALPQEYWFDNFSAVASFNHLNKIDDDRQIRFSLQGAGERYGEAISRTEKVDFSEGESMTVVEQEEATDTKYYVAGTVGYENNSAKRYFKDELLFSAQFRDNDGFGNGYSQRYSLPSFKAENSLETTFRTSDRHAVSFSSTAKFVSNSHSADFTTDGFSAHQDFVRRSAVLDNSVSSSFRIKGFSVNLNAGIDLEYHGIDSELRGLDLPDVVLSSSPDMFRLSPNLSLSSTFYIGRTEVRVSAPVGLDFLWSTTRKSLVNPSLAPSVGLVRRLSQNLKASARASYSMSGSEAESLLDAAVMSSHRSVSYSDGYARRQMARAGVNLEWEDNLNMFFAGVSASAYMAGSNRMATNLYSEDFTITGFTDAVSRSDGYGVRGSMSKFLGARVFVLELVGGWNRDSQNLQLQALEKSFVTDTWNASLSLRTNPADWISAELKANYVHTDISGGDRSAGDQIRLTGSVTVKPCTPLSIVADADYINEFVSGMRVTDAPLVKVAATWKFKRFSIVGECRNVLDCREFTREYVSAFQTVSSTTRLRGRQFLVGIRMSL